MRILVAGGGPSGLYFAILMKRADPAHQVVVVERNRPDDTFGFGVVFSDATIAEVEGADPDTYRAVTDHFVRWDDIDVHYGGECIRSTGHGFSGMSRQTLLTVLQEEAAALDVDLRFETELVGLGSRSLPRETDGGRDESGPSPFVLDRDAWDLVVAADGVNSTLREAMADDFGPTVDWRPNRFVWLGTTKPFPAFTFYFRENEHGLWRVHAYQYEPGRSTFIVECTDETWAAAGMDQASEVDTLRYCTDLFQEELDGHELIPNKSVWRSFPTVRCERWHVDNVVLIGDAAHTAHFSVGSGTRMGMLDAIALRDALVGRAASTDGDEGAGGQPLADVAAALATYEAERRPAVESLQRAAQASLEWFEATERYMDLDPVQFTFTLLTRSLRITHEDLRVRDPDFLGRVDAWVAEEAESQSGRPVSRKPSPPPMFTPFRLRELVVPNRVVVSPMCQYTAVDGTVGDWHLQHLGSRAVGGAGMVYAEMTDVSPEARISPGCAGLYKDEHVGAWKRIVDFVHQHSSAKIAIQLGHAGRKGATKNLWEGDAEPLEDGEWEIISASPIPYFPDRSQTPREMTRADMDEVVADYVRATERAVEAGFDLLEVHMAHGYLLASFISPLTNERDDEHGGSLENRMRFPLEVFDACRRVWPDERPMSVRVSAVDWAPGGMSSEESVEVARMLEAHGCDVVDVSSGQTVPDQRPRYGRLYQTPFADRIRHEVGISTMSVGNISSWMDVNTIIAAGRADLCLIARAHLFDPYWTRHAAHMLGYELPWPNQYKSVERYTPRFEFHFGGE
ncbi:MAG: bifunctional salicylyl-CoA 5-hydroxylase/oxidoreductase [Longimicrobiales bacterium]|nr:bifunctional salicylyl-CoA 5-hydroxylase/oxidoreductase [Longimicrobiales bacterium]